MSTIYYIILFPLHMSIGSLKFQRSYYVFVFFLLSLSSAQASSNFDNTHFNCSFFQNWLELRSEIKKMKNVKTKSEAMIREYKLSVDLAKQLFQSYTAHQLDTWSMETCLEGTDKTEFWQTLNRVFRNETIDQLAQSKSYRLQKLIDQVGREDFINYRIFFRVTGHLSEKSPSELVAGFHRGGRNIYVDISKVNPKDWIMIFIHELAHLADPKLSSASEVYAQKKWVKEFYEWSLKTESLDELPSEVRQRLTLWIESGLDRGLLFEYRAWYETFLIYDEMRKSNEIPVSPFIEYGKSQIDPNKKLASGLFEFLDRNSADPTEQIFSVPLIQNALKYVRSKLRSKYERF